MISYPKTFTFLVLASIIFIAGCGKKTTHAKKDESMKQAPAFTLPDENGTMHSLSDYAGQKVVLYFYPKDESPTCTAQACSIRDDFNMYKDHGIIVLGVSADTIESHKKFKEHHHLPFPLLADVDGAVAKAYGAKGGLLGFVGRSQRKTYLINEQGELVKLIDDVNVATQGQDILAGFGLNVK
jgi:peroxiredoxin Q/BCP